MINAVFLGVNLFLFVAIWKLMWKKTALDQSRDQIFDLRDEVRAYFMKREQGLSSPVYAAIRDLLNAHLRYTEELTFARYIATTVAMSSNPEIATKLRTELDKKLTSDDPELAEYISKVRQRAVVIMVNFMGETSLLLNLALVIFLPVFVLFRAVKALNRFAHHGNRRIVGGLRAALKLASMTGLLLAMPARAGIVGSDFDSSILEEYSYQASAKITP